jgi:hypothetical protein
MRPENQPLTNENVSGFLFYARNTPGFDTIFDFRELVYQNFFKIQWSA